MLTVIKKIKSGNRIVSYMCKKGDTLYEITKEDLLNFIKNKEVTNAKIVIYNGKESIRVELDKPKKAVEDSCIPGVSNIKEHIMKYMHVAIAGYIIKESRYAYVVSLERYHVGIADFKTNSYKNLISCKGWYSWKEFSLEDCGDIIKVFASKVNTERKQIGYIDTINKRMIKTVNN